MAKKKTPAPRNVATGKATTLPARDVDLETDADVQSASAHVSTAREQLKAAEAMLEQAREKAVQQVASLRDKSTGELIDTSLDFVRKHPEISVLTAASLGYLFARIFRR